MSECSESQRLSGALSGFHGPGLVVVPLRLRWEFPEPVRVRRCGQRVCASFLTSLNSEKKKDMKYHNAQSVLLPFWKNDPSLWLLLFRPSYLPDWDKARQQAEATPHFFWYGHIFLFCAVFLFFFFVFCFHCCTTGTRFRTSVMRLFQWNFCASHSEYRHPDENIYCYFDRCHCFCWINFRDYIFSHL